MRDLLVFDFIDATTQVADRFIRNFEAGHARSCEIYKDLQSLRAMAEIVKRQTVSKMNKPHSNQSSLPEQPTGVWFKYQGEPEVLNAK